MQVINYMFLNPWVDKTNMTPSETQTSKYYKYAGVHM